MREPTHADAELMIRLYELRRDPEMRRARQWFLTEFKAQSWTEIKLRYLTHTDEDRHFRMTTSYWEMVGTLVNRNVLHSELFFDHTGEDIVTWERCKDWIAEARQDIRPSYLIHFERMVEAHQAYRKQVNAEVLAERDGKTQPGRDRNASPARARGSAPARATSRRATARR
jgi:hypothetical protein